MHQYGPRAAISCRASVLLAVQVRLGSAAAILLDRRQLDRDSYESGHIPHVGLCGPEMLAMH